MTMRQAWIGFQAVILAVAAQSLIGINVHAQSVDMRAAAQAKAKGAQQARAFADPPVPQASAVGNYSVFDVPGATGTFPTSINLEGTITGSFQGCSTLSTESHMQQFSSS